MVLTIFHVLDNVTKELIMRVSEIFGYLNTFEKNHLLRIIEGIVSEKPKNMKVVDRILNEIDGQIKNADNLSVEQILNLIREEYKSHILNEFSRATSQLDIITDIIIRDGNSLMKREWLLKLYEKEIKELKNKSKSLISQIESDESNERYRDYRIYQKCLKVAYENDLIENRDSKVTQDEQSILNVLVNELDLSHEEVKLINLDVIPFQKLEIDEMITYLVKSGIILYSKRHHQIYVPDEIIAILRDIRGKEVSDKVFRRVLMQLRDAHINNVARKHNIDRKLSREEKIKQIIKEGVKFTKIMLSSIHKSDTQKSEKKSFVNDLIEKKLKINERIKGASLEDKWENLVNYFNEQDQEDNISISVHGYDKLLHDLRASLRSFDKQIRTEYELDDSIDISAKELLRHNLKPIDILYTLGENDLKKFCGEYEISTRGNEAQNVLKSYKDTQNLYLENYISISNRDLEALRANNIDIKESDLGVQYEELTKLIFKKMGLNVDDELRRKMNTSKDKIDILIRLEEDEVMIIECKTKKDKRFNTYSSASRQIKAYKTLAAKAGFRVAKTFIIAPSFSDDFIKQCGLDYELNLSLLSSKALIDIYNAFKDSKLKEFPYKILFRDVLIDSDRVVKAIQK